MNCAGEWTGVEAVQGTGLELESEAERGERLWDEVESKRNVLTRSINPAKLTAYLRQCKVLDEEDEDEVLNSRQLTSRKGRASRLLDMLRCRGSRGYEAFLESLELYYAELYRLLTGEEPTRRCSVLVERCVCVCLPVEEGPEGLTHFLMTEVLNLQKQLKEREAEVHKLSTSSQQLSLVTQELGSVQQHFASLRKQCQSHSSQLSQLRDDNYLLAMRYAQLTQEKNIAVLKARELQLGMGRLHCQLTGMEEECSLARRCSTRLRRDMQDLCSGQRLSELQQENSQLRARIQKQQVLLQAPSSEAVLLDLLDQDRREALEDRQELVQRNLSISQCLHETEQQRDQYLREKLGLELRCSQMAAQCELNKRRVTVVCQQLEEVEKERDQAFKARNEAQASYVQSLLARDEHWRQNWALQERLDRLETQMTDRDGKSSDRQGIKCSLPTGHSLDLTDFLDSSLVSVGYRGDGNKKVEKETSFSPNLRRRNCVKRSSSSPIKVSELRAIGDEKCTELCRPAMVASVDMESEGDINRFSILPFPPSQGSLILRNKEDDPIGSLASLSLASTMDILEPSTGVRELAVSRAVYIRVNVSVQGQLDGCSLQVERGEILQVLDIELPLDSDWRCARINPHTKEDLQQVTVPGYHRACRLLQANSSPAVSCQCPCERTQKQGLRSDVVMKPRSLNRIRSVQSIYPPPQDPDTPTPLCTDTPSRPRTTDPLIPAQDTASAHPWTTPFVCCESEYVRCQGLSSLRLELQCVQRLEAV
ncbi:caspase recruitment domain-containing protein 11 [Callorhinchus milii]|uniref:caspase recruitment domain-containing protein 11 n=1 Tax=Callorhinchus milii TaxID=7868 RepID=UPI001C3FD64E|nr:caspase recruitment domain-containing protein 11 [Callorhinchus milii]